MQTPSPVDGTPRSAAPKGSRRPSNTPAYAPADLTKNLDLDSPTEPIKPEEGDGRMSALRMISELVDERHSAQAGPLVVRAGSTAEHELLVSQVHYALASMLRDNANGRGSRLVPLTLTMSRITEMINDEAKRNTPREMIVKAFELDYPSAAEVLRQAMELRALFIIAEVRAESDLAALKDAVLDELLLNHLLVVVSGVPQTTELPEALVASSTSVIQLEVCAIGLYLSECNLSGRLVRDLLRRIKPAGDASVAPSHYNLVSALHLSSSEMSREVVVDLSDLLAWEACPLRLIDVSNTQVDGSALVAAIRSNATLTSLDARKVAGFAEQYEELGTALLEKGTRTRILTLTPTLTLTLTLALTPTLTLTLTLTLTQAPNASSASAVAMLSSC